MMSQNLSSAAVVIGALRVNRLMYITVKFNFSFVKTNLVRVNHICTTLLLKCALYIRKLYNHYLRNEFKFWNVHGIMNASGLLQSK